MARPGSTAPWLGRIPRRRRRARRRGPLARLLELDCRAFEGVARTHTPWLDHAVPALSRAANHSRLWMGVAAGLALAGGSNGQRAAARGLGSIAVTSVVVNQVIKRVVRRPRPSLRNVPAIRYMPVQPLTTSFPSGHAASAAAFTAGVAAELPRAALPLGAVAGAVAYSRVYVGVHYPIDVLVGGGVGLAVALLSRRPWPTVPSEARERAPSARARRLPANGRGTGLVVVANRDAGAGLGPDPVERVRERLPDARIVELDDPGRLERALHQAAEECEVLAVCGGDGSASVAAQVAIERSLPLLLLPAGTLNHLARDLRLDSVDDAITAFAGGQAIAIDVASIDGHPFVNMAGFGAYAAMLDARTAIEKRVGRWPAHVIAFLRALVRARPLTVTIEGRKRRTWTAFIGNCRHEPAGFAPSWRPRMDDGRLDVRLLLGERPLARLRLIGSILTGRLTKSPTFEQFDAESLAIDSGRPRLRLARDGEQFEGNGSFAVDKRPEALVVYAGGPSDAGQAPSSSGALQVVDP